VAPAEDMRNLRRDEREEYARPTVPRLRVRVSSQKKIKCFAVASATDVVAVFGSRQVWVWGYCRRSCVPYLMSSVFFRFFCLF